MSKKVIIGSNVGYEILKYDIKSKIFNYLVESVSKSKLESNLIRNECNLNELLDNNYSILFKLNRVYKIHEFDDLLSNKLKSSKYKFSSIDFVKSNFENTYRLYFSNQDYSSNFVNILGKLIDIDVIELYAKDNMNKIRRIGIAHIPDINTSLLCNKFISKNELSNLRCKFNFKFKKWVPLKVINEKYFECAKYEDINNYMCNIIGN